MAKKTNSRFAIRTKAMAALSTWPARANVFEVGPRDGLQSEARTLSVETRVELIRLLVAAGLPDIEVGSFVRSDRIPQLAGTSEVLGKLSKMTATERGGARFWAFVPNEHGLEQAIAAGLDGASFFIGASDTFCRKNVNRGRDELFKELPALFKKATKNKLKTRVYLSTLVYCPYEGPVAPQKVIHLVEQLFDAGAHEIALSDTTGDANPRSLRTVLEGVLKKHPAKNFALHLHDTRGLALANVLEGLSHGLTRFDSSVGGMGGCPYAPGASGNLATEDLLNMLSGMGLSRGVVLGRVAKAGFFAEQALGKKLPSSMLRTLENHSEGTPAHESCQR